jgi:hypothetical protein
MQLQASLPMEAQGCRSAEKESSTANRTAIMAATTELLLGKSTTGKTSHAAEALPAAAALCPPTQKAGRRRLSALLLAAAQLPVARLAANLQGRNQSLGCTDGDA